jgi:exonuclease SbcD
MSITILHTADLHIDSSFGFLSNEKAAIRREGQFLILEEIVSMAERFRVDAVLICGDLFDKPNVSFDVANRVSNILSRTAIPIFITPGNHDYFHTSSPYNLTVWPENVRIFTSQIIEKVELANMVLYGAGFTSQNQFQSMLSDFNSSQDYITEGLHKSKLSVMMLHGEINPPEPRYHPIYAKDIAASGVDYLALGHIHGRTEPQKVGRTIYAYCGCPEGRGFDETGSKGVYLVNFDEGTKVTFLPLDGAKYLDLSVDLSACRSPKKAVLQAMPADIQNSLLRVTLTGEIEPDRLSIEDIEESLSSLAFHVSLIDRTRPPVNVWEECGDDTLKGIFLSLLKERLNDDIKSEDRKLIELAARYGLDALDGEESGNYDNS